MIDDLLGEFLAETQEMLEALGGEIVAWETNPDDRSRLDSIFRFVHTVKGNCGLFDFPRLEALSHAAEDALADVRAGRRSADRALVSAVLAVIDRIGDMVEAIKAGEEYPAGGDEALIAALAPRDEEEEVRVTVPVVAQGSERSPRANAQHSIRLPVELLDWMMSGVSNIVLARNELARRLREQGGTSAVDGPFERLSAMIADLRDAITRTRMQPIEVLFGSLPRLVRDLSHQLGKQVMIDVDGDDVELDREMIEVLRDPLLHIIRNAIDHGMETPAQRLAAGKREIGLLTVLARQSGNQIGIEIIDDGRGINADALVEKAIAAGALTPERAAQMSLHERLMLVCRPGLSTAAEITSISGRGVGMDVVRNNIERIGGTLEIDSTLGAGTRIALRVPLTLTITPALIVGSGDLEFAIPRSYIEEVIDARLGNVEISHLGGTMLAKVRDKRLPCIALGDVLAIGRENEGRDGIVVVLRYTATERYALLVDRLLDHEELAVKPVSPPVMATGLYAGTTLSDDGHPILLLDINGIARIGGISQDLFDETTRTPEVAPAAQAGQGTPVVLFTALDGQRRAIRMAVIERIVEIEVDQIEFGGDRPIAVIGERLYPLAGAEDRAGLPAGVIRLALLSDGHSSIAYAFKDRIDISAMVESAGTGSESLDWVTLIDGEPIRVVDVHELFANSGNEHLAGQAPVCRLPQNDPWVDNFLRPIVQSAGYRVVGEADETPADIGIVVGEPQAPLPDAGQTILLRFDRDAADDADRSIYRYDTESLLAVLASAKTRRA